MINNQRNKKGDKMTFFLDKMTFGIGIHSQPEISKGLDEVNEISRRAMEKKQILLPCSLVIGIISSVALGVFHGAPFFCIGALAASAACYAIRCWYLTDLEIVDKYRNYFNNRESFHFYGYLGGCQKVVEVNYKHFGYPRFILENA